MTTRRILVLTNDAGMGHRRAANATMKALTERYGDACEATLLNLLDEPGVPEKLRNIQSDYNRVVRTAPAIYSLGYGMTNTRLVSRMVEELEAQLLHDPLERVLARVQPDVIVVTHPIYIYLLVSYRRRHDCLWSIVVLVTDLARLQRLWFRKEVDLYLVPTTQAASLAAQRGIPSDRVQITGIPVDLRLAGKLPAPGDVRAALGWDPRLPAIIVSGGRRVIRFTDFVKALDNARLPAQLVIIAGDDGPLYDQMNNRNWRSPAHVYGYREDFPVLLTAADALATKAGGLTVAESLAAGVPLFIFQCMPMHEKGNAEYVVAAGAGCRVQEPDELVEALRLALADDGRSLAAMARRAYELGRPNAARDVADRIWMLTEQHSPRPDGVTI